MSDISREVISIFVSSPGDVAQERTLVERVIRRLRDEYAGIRDIQSVLWEQQPLLASSGFQEQIPRASDSDILVCILWSRLGTPVGPVLRRNDGTLYSSGTEFEFEDAMRSFEANGSPKILVYRKTADPISSLADEKVVLDRLKQKRALDEFIAKWFIRDGVWSKNSSRPESY